MLQFDVFCDLSGTIMVEPISQHLPFIKDEIHRFAAITYWKVRCHLSCVHSLPSLTDSSFQLNAGELNQNGDDYRWTDFLGCWVIYMTWLGYHYNYIQCEGDHWCKCIATILHNLTVSSLNHHFRILWRTCLLFLQYFWRFIIVVPLFQTANSQATNLRSDKVGWNRFSCKKNKNK